MSRQMGFAEGANQAGQNFGLGRQICDSKYCPTPKALGDDQNGAANYVQDYQDEGYQGYQEEEQVYQEDGTDY